MQNKAKSHISLTNVSDMFLVSKFQYLKLMKNFKKLLNFKRTIAEQKILELAEKYKELKKSGKIENFLAKQRKRALGKDHKHLNKNNEHLRFK